MNVFISVSWSQMSALPLDAPVRGAIGAGAFDDAFGVAHRSDIGVENLLWSSDFPHSATFWPHSREKIAKDFQGVGADDKQKILSQNTAKLYGFNVN